MSIFYDYFLAASDEQAAATIDWDGGPGKPNVGDALPTIDGTGVEPTVTLGLLECMFTGATFESIMADYEIVSERDGGEGLVIRLSDGIHRALASADEARLREIAHPWSEIEEFWGQGDPIYLAEFLIKLAAIVRDGATRGHKVYCWICL